jgi:hypothetical protein
MTPGQPSRPLPFVEAAPGAPPAYQEAPPEPPRAPAPYALNRTAIAEAPDRDERALPFVESGVADRLTLEQYAALCVEINLDPSQKLASIRKFGIPDEAAHREISNAYRLRFLHDPALRERWFSLCSQLREAALAGRARR